MRSFDTWNYEQVEDTFGIKPIRTNPQFAQWLKADGCQPSSEAICQIFAILQKSKQLIEAHITAEQ